jgi:hypothetical protein
MCPITASVHQPRLELESLETIQLDIMEMESSSDIGDTDGEDADAQSEPHRVPLGDQYGQVEVSLFFEEEWGHIQTVLDVVGDTRIWTFIDGKLESIRRTPSDRPYLGELYRSLLANVVTRDRAEERRSRATNGVRDAEHC